MSTKREIIILEPDGRIHNEAFVSAPKTCRYCNGRGGFPIDTIDGPSIEECPDCEGTGEVQAMVSITWAPAPRKNVDI